MRLKNSLSLTVRTIKIGRKIMHCARFSYQPQTTFAESESGFIRKLLMLLMSLMLTLVVWSMWASASLAVVEIVPGGPEAEVPILQGCQGLDLGLNDGQTDFDPVGRVVRSRAEGEFASPPNVSFIEVQDRFIPQLSFPATVNVNSNYLGYLEAFVASDDLSQASARIEISLREFQNLADNEGTIIDNHIAFNESVTAGDRLIDSQSDGNPNATFDVDLLANRIYGVVLRLETRADGLGVDADLDTEPSVSDFFSGNRSVFLSCVQIVPNLADSDGDGLYDIWEEEGIDLELDGVVELGLPTLGADPLHKDIFIEVDYMPNHRPNPDAINDVIQAFANAPVDNPDGNNGITLHIEVDDELLVDEEVLDIQTWCDDEDGVNECVDVNEDFTNDFDSIKSTYFGTLLQRLAANEEDVLLAKQLVYRYGLFAHGRDGGTSSGRAKRGGNFIVSLGASSDPNPNVCRPWDPDPISGHCVGSREEQAGTFMHELGHTLRLGHGGSDGVNGKPNYLSVMNYFFQTVWVQNVSNPRLDYSRQELPSLLESPPGLDENDGIGLNTVENPNDLTEWFDPTIANFVRVPGQVNQPLDWNNDNDGGIDVSVIGDISGDRVCVSPGNDGNLNSVPQGDDIFVDANGDNVNDRIDDGSNFICESPALGDDEQGRTGWQSRQVGQLQPSLNGHDDWEQLNTSSASFSFRTDLDFLGAAEALDEEEPELTAEEAEENESFWENVTDLEITKSASADTEIAVAGQNLVYTLTIQNNGPNLARDVQVTDTLPPQVTYVSSTVNCVENPGGELTCNLGEIPSDESIEFNIVTRIPADLPCAEAQSITIENNARVTNLVGSDYGRTNNQVAERTEVLCIKYEYSAKLICGKQNNPDDLRLARGLYATAVNIHNPNDEPVHFFKKLALTYPPKEQKPGRIIPIAVDTLQYDEALAVDCLDIQKEAFNNEFPESYVKGFIVIQSPRSLDVTAVYTTASLDKRGKATEHSSIDVEQIRERVREQPEKVELPDLIPLAPLPAPPFDEEFGVQLPEGIPGSLFCAVNSPQGGASQSISVTVRNQGLAIAGASITVADFFLIDEQVPIETPSLEAGEEVTLDFEVPQGCYNLGSCRFRLIVDAGEQGGVVTEFNENNNVVESLCLAPAG